MVKIVNIEGVDEELEFPDDTEDSIVENTVQAILQSKKPPKKKIDELKQFILSKPKVLEAPEAKEKETEKEPDIKPELAEISEAIESLAESIRQQNTLMQVMMEVHYKSINTLMDKFTAEKELIYKDGLVVGSKVKTKEKPNA